MNETFPDPSEDVWTYNESTLVLEDARSAANGYSSSHVNDTSNNNGERKYKTIHIGLNS
ncbi:uncharacterized protein RAG0_02006 [Rhynchosporium agropyri]|uniref:Uncharacterized protein n=1 Tax=Rhynchosporium agropyri TaxID=914238 RepID=A0A1E1K072_9HELO|nr:uncharacterized protein RAG0_02006 [Rhynchosporium agropyri]